MGDNKLLTRKFFFIFLLLLLSFGYGVLVGNYKWFPFEQIRTLKTTFFFHKKSYKVPEKINTLSEKLSSSEAIKLRDRLLKAIVPIDEIDVSVKSNANTDILETSYYGLNLRGKLDKAHSRSSCLRIYIQGHGGNPDNFNYYNQLHDNFLSSGCDVLSLSMLGIGLNGGEVSFPTRFGSMELTVDQASHHGNYNFFFDDKNPNLDALSLFLYPHIRLIDYVVNHDEYENIAIMGISGGGWYTVWLAALMPELSLSISYAGSLPLAYRNDKYNHGDWEQVYSPLYKLVSYLQLYQLMLINEIGNQTRQAFLIYNDNDACCFMDPAASDLKARLDNFEFYPQVIIKEEKFHRMDVPTVLRLLKQD